jgi:hypothetical protein
MTPTNPSKPKIVVYTAIFAPIKDKLYEPVDCGDGVRYEAFVEDPSAQTEAGWHLRPAIFQHKEGRKRARRHKVLAHKLYPDAEATLWVDGCLTPKEDIRQLVEWYLSGCDLCMFEHGERTCVYRELEACLRLQKDSPTRMRTQIHGYRRAGYPYNNGLAETTAVLRRHTPQIELFNETWWEEISKGSVRDQLSVNFVCWKLGVSYNTFEGTRTCSPHFTWRAHR